MKKRKPTPQERIEVYVAIKEDIFRRRKGGNSWNPIKKILRWIGGNYTVEDLRELNKVKFTKQDENPEGKDPIDILNSCIRKAKSRAFNRKMLWFLYSR